MKGVAVSTSKDQNNLGRRDFLKAAGTAAVATSLAAPEHIAFFGEARGAAFGSDFPANNGLRYRQIHLDFHTSEQIEGIGDQFDPEEFAATLQKARVDSVTCFGRCHHGWIYYDTNAFPERRHPHLKRNLLKEQIEACHARNIRVPIYVTIQWDHYTANHHPEWLSIDHQGRVQGTAPFEPGFYRNLCLNTPYVEFLKKHVAELMEVVPADGLFLDIVKAQDCACSHCRAGMEKKGLEPSDQTARRQFGLEVTNRFKKEMSALIRQRKPECTIFYNSGHVGTRHREAAASYTHFELESLPSGGWGYLHFPLTMRYARNLGADCLGMTGKFHTSWGDFHSFKNQAALEFECFHALALGARCSVGDQLHPSGKIDDATYQLIGNVFTEVEKKEPWCYGTRPVVDIGVLTPEEQAGGDARALPAALGFTLLLQEGRHQFDVLDSKSDFSRYKLLILPDEIRLSPETAAKIDRYVGEGGALIASHRAGFAADKEEFILRSLGVRAKGEAPFSPDFILPAGAIGKGLPETEHVMYMKALEVEVQGGAEVLAPVILPYFNRTYRHFCSHRHTPSAGKTGYPGVVRNGRAIYFAHPIFRQYHQNAPRWCKTLMLNAIDLLLPEPLVRVEAPSTTLTALNEQPAQKRWILHLLNYMPQRRGQDFDVLEDVIPVFDLKVSLKAPTGVRQVVLVPDQQPLEFKAVGGRLEFIVPRLAGHGMIAVQFA
jgi:hypothetical protein